LLAYLPNADKLTQSDELFLRAAVTRFSRLFDTQARVPAGWFAPSNGVLSTQIHEGSNAAYLQIAPHVPGSVSRVWINGVQIALSAFAETVDNRYLVLYPCNYHGCGCNFSCDSFTRALQYWATWQGCVVVEACWGWPDIPADVQEAVLSMVALAWRKRDPAQAVTVGLDGQPVRVVDTTMQWKAALEGRRAEYWQYEFSVA
jgi:hypothetical protein